MNSSRRLAPDTGADANGRVTRYLYDERDSLKEVWESPNAWTNPASTPSPKYVTAYQYDHSGNLSRVTRASGDSSYERAVDYKYDGLNRVRTETQYPNRPSTGGYGQVRRMEPVPTWREPRR